MRGGIHGQVLLAQQPRHRLHPQPPEVGAGCLAVGGGEHAHELLRGLLVWRARENGDTPLTKLGESPIRILIWVLVAVGAVVLILGTIVTGSGPHSGDADTPNRFNLDPEQMSWLHADAVILFIGLTIGLLVALSLTKAPPRAVRATWILLGVSLLQGLIGYVQYFTDLPWALVALHILGSTLVWIALLRIPLSMRTRGEVLASTDERVDANG